MEFIRRNPIYLYYYFFLSEFGYKNLELPHSIYIFIIIFIINLDLDLIIWKIKNNNNINLILRNKLFIN